MATYPIILKSSGRPYVNAEGHIYVLGSAPPSPPDTDWVPPIGIPAPSFGISEQVPGQPSAWPSAASVGSYYIDSTHSAATDTSNPYGYPDKPRMTIPSEMGISAGSVTEIHGGPYLVPLSGYDISIDAAGTNPPTADAPAFIRGFSGTIIGMSQEAIDAKVSANISIGFGNLAYAIFENLHFKHMPMVFCGMDTHHLAVRYCEFSDHHSPPVIVCPTQDGVVHDLVFHDNLLHDSGNWQDTGDSEDYHGINMNLQGRISPTEIHNVWVLDSTFYHLSGDSVQVNGDGHFEALHHVYIGRNTSHENRQSAAGIKESSDIIISQNRMYSMRHHGAQRGNGMAYQYGPNRLWIMFNEIYDCNFGIRQTDTTGPIADHASYIIGNHIHDLNQDDGEDHWGSPSGWGISLWAGVMHRHVVDNTIENIYGGVETIMGGPLDARNNIILNLKPIVYSPETFGTYRNHMEANGAGDGIDVDYTNCLLYGAVETSSQVARIKWLGYDSSLPDMQSIGKMPDCRNVDPLLTDGVPAVDSPAVGASSEADVYATFFDLYGIDIRKDFTGRSRPIGSAWDIGAFQHN